MQVSCLKFEPRVSNFPVIKSTLGFYNQYYYEKSLKRVDDCFSKKNAKTVILFFILQCLKNIVRLGLEKLFMKVGYYDTE